MWSEIFGTGSVVFHAKTKIILKYKVGKVCQCLLDLSYGNSKPVIA